MAERQETQKDKRDIQRRQTLLTHCIALHWRRTNELGRCYKGNTTPIDEQDGRYWGNITAPFPDKRWNASECLLLELAIFTIVQMLLVRAGIETNPGPTSPTSSVCCNAYQHFRRVENTIEKAQNYFQSKVTQDTLTKKLIEIEETGKYLSFFIREKQDHLR